jgi:DNA-binding NtrC family response regulator
MVRARVLLLEDDPVLMDVLREVLEDESLDVTVCTSLGEIKAAIRQFPEAIVVSDSWNEHEHEALSAQQRDEIVALGRTAAVILATGRTWAARSHEGEFGSVVVVQKPYDLTRLIEAIRTALEPDSGGGAPPPGLG